MLTLAEPPPTELARVFLVDDDPAVRSALIFAFSFDGFEVEAFDTAEALLAADVRGADCLVIDYRLPGLDGLELIEQLREHGVSTPVVLITSQPKLAIKAHAASLGVSLIEKPLLTDELVETIRGLLREPKQPGLRGGPGVV
jgi:two-component system response regulator FixJ